MSKDKEKSEILEEIEFFEKMATVQQCKAAENASYAEWCREKATSLRSEISE